MNWTAPQKKLLTEEKCIKCGTKGAYFPFNPKQRHECPNPECEYYPECEMCATPLFNKKTYKNYCSKDCHDYKKRAGKYASPSSWDNFCHACNAPKQPQDKYCGECGVLQ